MDKKAFAAVPRPILTKQNKEILLLVPHMCYLVIADRREINGKDTLVLNFFRAKRQELKPEFRTFCQTEDYITQDLTTDKTKWKTGAIDFLTGYRYWHRNTGNIVIASVPERGKILSFLQDFRKKHGIKERQMDIPKGATVDSEVEYRISEYQDTIKKWRLQTKHEKEMSEIDRQMEKFGELPTDYSQFVKDTVFQEENYIFYSRPKKRAYCTKCGHDFELRKDGLYCKKIAIWNDTDQIKHNKTVRCPYCNSFFMCKSEGMGRQQLFAIQWSVLVQKYGDEVLVRYFCHTKDFRTNFRNPRIESSERFRTIHTGKESVYFEWSCFKSTRNLRWCYFKDRSYGHFQPSEMIAPRSAVLYNRDLREAVSGTCMKYSAVDIYVDHVVRNSPILNKPWCIDWYFNAYRKKPYLEQLLKVGFYKLTRSVLKNDGGPKLKTGRTVIETLGVDKQQFRMLRGIGNPTARDVGILQYAGKIRKGDFDLLRSIRDDGYDGMYKKYLDMRKYTTIYKVDKYIHKRGIKHARDYFDYIRWLEEMGYDMQNEYNLYPKDFVRAHDEKSKEYVKFQDKRAKEAEERFNRVLEKLHEKTIDAEPMRLQMNGLFIRLPRQLDELKTEGEYLHHCVGTYRDKVAEGKTMIFFIRRLAEPGKPYYTLEWKGQVIQCRGSHNCDMTPEVKAFVKMFQEKMVAYEKLENGMGNYRKAG